MGQHTRGFVISHQCTILEEMQGRLGGVLRNCQAKTIPQGLFDLFVLNCETSTV